MELQPLGARVVAKRIEKEQKTEHGIVIPESAQDRPNEAEVVAVGPGKRENGQVVEPDVERGDRILIGDYSGSEIEIGGEEYLVVNAEDILAKVV